MKTFGQRLKFFREDLRLTQEEFAEKLGYGTTQTMISKWERIPKENYLGKNIVLIKRAFPQLNDDWLATGNGEMKIKTIKLYPEIPEAAPVVNDQSIEYLKQLLDAKDTIIDLQARLIASTEKREPPTNGVSNVG